MKSLAPHRVLTLSAGLALAGALGPPAAADVNDGHGRIWRELTDTTNLTWQQVATVCPTDGHTPGSGSLGGKDFTGWTWATQDQVTRLFSYWQPEILTTPYLTGPSYFLQALFFTGTFRPTREIHIETFDSMAVLGWTATANPDGTVMHAAVGASFPVFMGSWRTDFHGDPTFADQYSGFWLFRPDPAFCPADFTGDGLVDFSDYLEFLNLYDAQDPRTDLNEDGLVDFSDYLEFLNLFDAGC